LNITNRQTHNLVQGSPEWHAYRNAVINGIRRLNASDAPAMMGVSPYKTRDQLIAEYATGETKEVSPHAQALFDAGHDYEASARVIAEKIIGDDLYPVVMSCEADGLPLSASLDGLTMDAETGWEHKSLNKNLRESLAAGKVPEQYFPQLEQQLLVTGANRILFMASNGTEDTALYCWYESSRKLRAKLLTGWAQFMQDVAAYKPPVAAPEVVADPIKALPALVVQVSGKVEASNLVVYQEGALRFIESINTDLKTDEEFANAKSMVKFCAEAEAQLEATKAMVLGQMSSVDEVIKAVAFVQEQVRQKRLTLDTLVTNKETQIKNEIRERGPREVAAHITALNARIGKPYMPNINTNFIEVTKGKRTLASMNSAVNDEVARVKIEADTIANRIEKNLLTLKELADGYQTLFAGDIKDLVLKANDDLTAVIGSRISKHQQEQAAKIEAEAKRLADEAERTRIAAEVKAQAEAQAKALSDAKLAAVAVAPEPMVAPLVTPVAPITTVAAVVPVTTVAPPMPGARERLVAAINSELQTLSLPQLKEVFAFIESISDDQAA
jgi:putative phage-type endonuclease